MLGEQVLDAVDVALRVDDERDAAVVHDVAAVAERRRLERDDGQRPGVRVRGGAHVGVLSRCGAGQEGWVPVTTGRPARVQADVPPATE